MYKFPKPTKRVYYNGIIYEIGSLKHREHGPALIENNDKHYNYIYSTKPEHTWCLLGNNMFIVMFNTSSLEEEL